MLVYQNSNSYSAGVKAVEKILDFIQAGHVMSVGILPLHYAMSHGFHHLAVSVDYSVQNSVKPRTTREKYTIWRLMQVVYAHTLHVNDAIGSTQMTQWKSTQNLLI